MRAQNPYLKKYPRAQKFYTTKINKHTVCGCSLFTYSFDSNKNKHDFLQRNVTKDKEVRYNTKTTKTIKPQI